MSPMQQPPDLMEKDRKKKNTVRTRRLKLTAWLEGALEALLGGRKARESPEGTLGRQGGQAAGCQWPQAYKSNRGASAGRGTAGRVGEAGPFLLGKSRRARVSAGAERQAGSLGEFGGGPARAELGEANLPRSADTVTPLAKKGRSPSRSNRSRLGGACVLPSVLHLGPRRMLE